MSSHALAIATTTCRAVASTPIFAHVKEDFLATLAVASADTVGTIREKYRLGGSYDLPHDAFEMCPFGPNPDEVMCFWIATDACMRVHAAKLSLEQDQIIGVRFFSSHNCRYETMQRAAKLNDSAPDSGRLARMPTGNREQTTGRFIVDDIHVPCPGKHICVAGLQVIVNARSTRVLRGIQKRQTERAGIGINVLWRWQEQRHIVTYHRALSLR